MIQSTLNTQPVKAYYVAYTLLNQNDTVYIVTPWLNTQPVEAYYVVSLKAEYRHDQQGMESEW